MKTQQCRLQIKTGIDKLGFPGVNSLLPRKATSLLRLGLPLGLAHFRRTEGRSVTFSLSVCRWVSFWFLLCLETLPPLPAFCLSVPFFLHH